MPGDEEIRLSDRAFFSFPPPKRRKRFKLHTFLTALEFAAFRIAATGSFLYCLYRVFMHEIGR
jgi:hypothetical protein